MTTKTSAQLISDFIYSISNSDTWDLPAARTGFKIKRMSNKLKKDLKEKCSTILSYRQQCSRVRMSIKDAGIKHHAIDFHLKNLAKSHKEASKDILSLEGKSASTIEEGLKKISQGGTPALQNDIKSFKVYSEAFYIVKLSSDEYEEANEIQDKRLAEKFDTKNMLSINVESMVKLTERLLCDSDKWRKVLGVGLATGRRLNEITYSGNFKLVDEERIEFSGTLKGGDDKREEEFVIYSLVNTKLVLEALKELREEKRMAALIGRADAAAEAQGMSEALKIMNNSCGASANKITRGVLQSISKNRKWTFRDSRAIWARCLVELHYKEWEKDNAGKTPTDMLKEQLRHEFYTEQMNYKHFIISDAKVDVEQIIENVNSSAFIPPKFDVMNFKSFKEMYSYVSDFDEKIQSIKGKKGRELLNTQMRVKNFIFYRFNDELGETIEFKLKLKDIHKRASNGGIGVNKQKAVEYWGIISDGREEKNTISKEENA